MSTLRTAVVVVAVAAVAAGCQPAEDGAGEPAAAPTSTAAVAPTVAEPTPSGSPTAVTAANTEQVCRAVDKLILAGSRRLAADSAAATRDEATPEELNARLKRTLAGLADDVRDQAGRAEDPRIEALIADIARRLDAGARSSSPAKWMGDTFVDIPPRLARDCRA
ncbi:hypothetical protein ACFY2R_03235 [Micromonospora olivasterospora]|uniref:hypothetical protein n=1 Tax=Micromonospora olivasterospora TaxID=1880 RepID=UPI00119D7006